jgi:protein arginine kinase
MVDLNNIAVASRVRLARNVRDVNFPHKLDNESAYSLMKKTYDTVNTDNNYNMYVMAQLSEVQRGAFVEKHLISPALAKSDRIGALLVDRSEKVSLMLNEEDHIRAQAIENGFNLEGAHKEINKVDDKLISGLNVAFDRDWGFLTCCPTNLGTGMRASVMLFLPMLTLNNEMGNAAKALAKRYITVRGSYGEGSQANGHMYQVSNQASLGVSESEIILAVTSAVETLCAEEYRMLEHNFGKKRIELTDTILRAKGIMTNAYKISSHEFTQLFINVKLGVTLGVIKCKNISKLNKLTEQVLPNNLMVAAGRELNEIERDLYRAEYIKKILKEILD